MTTLEQIKKGEGLHPIPTTSKEFSNNELKEMLEKMRTQPTNLIPNEKNFEYYKGFYDATHKFMQIFEKLIEAGMFNGTKLNSSN